MEFPETALQGLMTPTATHGGRGLSDTTRRPAGFFMPARQKGARMSLTTCLVVMLGGTIGTLARYVVSVLALPIIRELPWGTIAINITGSFLIGFFGTLTLAHGRYPVSENIRLFVMVGFCGGYTTFSAFSLQTLDLLSSGAVGRATVNIVASVILCVAAVSVDHVVAARFNDGATEIAQVTSRRKANWHTPLYKLSLAHAKMHHGAERISIVFELRRTDRPRQGAASRKHPRHWLDLGRRARDGHVLQARVAAARQHQSGIH